MKFISFDDRVWRLLTIRWQRDLYGSGAHATGGRWNAVGTRAIYFANDHSSAIAEYHQDIVRPGVLAAYNVQTRKIVDLTNQETLKAYDIDPDDRFCQWRTIYKIEGGVPPSWRIADRLIAEGAHGAIIPSVQFPGGVNLVLWRWSSQPGDGASVRLIDPDGDLDSMS